MLRSMEESQQLHRARSWTSKWAVASTLCIATVAIADPLIEPVRGPTLLCFKYSTFQLLKNERVTDFAGSAEGMSLTIEGPTGRYEVGESEIFVEPAKRGRRLLLTRDQTTIYRIAGTPRYAIYGPTSYSSGKARLVVWLSGPALSGDSEDGRIYRRVDVRDTSAITCSHRFTYSWEAFLGD